MLLILNLVFLIIFFNKDIFFEKKEDRDKRIEKEKLENLKKIELEELKNKEKIIKVDKKEIKKTQKK